MSLSEDTPLAFLERKQKELLAEERVIEHDLSRLFARQAQTRSELARVQAALAAFRNAEAHASEDGRPRTIQEGVLRVLEAAPYGMPAIRILEELKKRFDMDYPRSSLSPQLSRLKGQGKLKLNGMVWSLTRK